MAKKCHETKAFRVPRQTMDVQQRRISTQEGLCRDINLSIFNCGKCGHRCPLDELCFFGMCGYGMGSSPFLVKPSKRMRPKPPQIPWIPSYHYPPPPIDPKEEF
ncbi:stigma-specific Stig1 family protein [Medicago truncatula]|uniref:Stigma-specific Stig1 family protein n=1 Tax=Medicago truncatula TaxID=3880 RepID=A0A072UVP4_MEDTR|nr:stigma-specific Stig1 family protein [Medicago truncatula]